MLMVPPAGFEPATLSLEVSCSSPTELRGQRINTLELRYYLQKFINSTLKWEACLLLSFKT